MVRAWLVVQCLEGSGNSTVFCFVFDLFTAIFAILFLLVALNQVESAVWCLKLFLKPDCQRETN